MVDIFDEAVTGDYIQATDLNQIFDAWEGETDKGVPLRLTQVDSATYHAGEFRNKNASGKHLLVQNRAGETLLSIVGDVITFGKDVTVDPGLYVDGVDIGAHVHSGDAGDAPQLTAGSYGAGTIPAAAFATGAIATAVTGADVPIIIARQGGSDTHWGYAGGTTTQTVSTPYIQCGCAVIGGGQVGQEDVSVSFPTAFTYIPIVHVDLVDNLLAGFASWVTVLGTTIYGFTARIYTRSAVASTNSGTFYWTAIGPIA